MGEYGGFFELELNRENKGEQFHQNAIKLNTGRSCLRYILRVKSFNKLYIPYYCCDSIIDVIKEEDIKYNFYKINNKLEPIVYDVKTNEAILYINYFGLKNQKLKELANKYDNLIVDNTQAFFHKPFNNKIPTFYSPRKFFGVPDGGYLYFKERIDENLNRDISYNRFKHLLLRIDKDADSAYKYYQENEKKLKDQGIKKMSNLTQSLLSYINYSFVLERRNDNFKILHNYLNKYNELNIDYLKNLKGPMIYPLLIKNNNLRKKLIANKIYIPIYWKEVLGRTKEKYFGNYITKFLVPLPVDQRYNKKEMKEIARKVINLM